VTETQTGAAQIPASAGDAEEVATGTLPPPGRGRRVPECVGGLHPPDGIGAPGPALPVGGPLGIILTPRKSCRGAEDLHSLRLTRRIRLVAGGIEVGHLHPGTRPNPAHFEGGVEEIHLGDATGRHIYQVDRREHGGRAHADSAGLPDTGSR
jgi:hypothetical protein